MKNEQFLSSQTNRICIITQYKWNKFRNTKNQNQEKNKFLNEKRKEKNNNSDSQNNANDVQNNTLPKAFVIGKMLIENFESNFHSKRFKYNPLVYDFAMLMYLTWAKSYDQLR